MPGFAGHFLFKKIDTNTMDTNCTNLKTVTLLMAQVFNLCHSDIHLSPIIFKIKGINK